jgi:hypothetical protein
LSQFSENFVDKYIKAVIAKQESDDKNRKMERKLAQ